MLDKLAGIVARYEELERLISDPANVSDYEKVAEYAQERAELEDIVQAARVYQQAMDELEQARVLFDDPDMADLAREEASDIEARIPDMEAELLRLLLPRDPRDDKNVIVEIRAGTGGDEAGIFAADLFRMYTRYAENNRWKVEVLDSSDTGVGGYKEIVFAVKGKGAYSRLKYESGVHRVQRVPVTESQGRIHTSTATVAVLAEMDDVEVDINPNDLRIDTFRSGGAGGQNVQKNETAIRITHLPSGIVVACQDERSQLQNKLRAMSVLRAKLYDMEQERIRSEQDADRRSQVGTGERSEKIRTYNYPQNRVTDHRIGMTVYNLPAVIDGGLDEFIDELATRDEADRLQAVGV
ncbi:MAG TPA: peptide chain release factor 1 [Aggregatilinea sp.]|uniref:peptide chain release factor 1 n=1 Tax=Aggregatilinea sp. TaxID=2806333 RepID=UPI002B5EEC93|nr:peptide chain release factor 1 [Aggregatilinea sp.]HML24428.1 peptide chain release factor 1 [Aggregatilinea sp.]